MVNEPQIEYGFIGKLHDLKYTYRSDIRNRKTLEENFREKFEALNRVSLPMRSSPACWMRSSRRMSSPPPKPCGSATASPATMARRCTTPWSTSRTGARTTSRSSTSSASTPTTATTATTSSCSSTACRSCRSS